MKYWQLLERLKNLTEDQLLMDVIALIDGEPWEASDFKISSPNDDWKPNHPYFVYS